MPWASGSANAACPWGRPRPSSTPRRPKILAAVGPPAVTVRGRLAEKQADRTPKPVRVVFLGGLGEIGRNCACIEVDGRIIVLDCGIMFPDPDMPGIDLVLPEFTYLREQATGSTASC